TSLEVNNTENYTFNISNNGYSDLVYKIDIQESDGEDVKLLPLAINNSWTHQVIYQEGNYYEEDVFTTQIYDITEYNGDTYYLLEYSDNKYKKYGIKNLFVQNVNDLKEDWTGWRLDENGDFYEAYYNDYYGFREIKLMDGNPSIGTSWDATGYGDILEIVDKITVINEFGVYEDCWVVKLDEGSWYLTWVYKFGMGLLYFEEIDDSYLYMQSLSDYTFGVNWLSLSIDFGLIAPDGSNEIDLAIFTYDIAEEEYYANVNIRSNDPFSSLVEIPVDLQVVDNVADLSDEMNFNIYPNPISNQAIISFELKKTEFINISVYNTFGQIVKIMYNYVANAGINNVQWNVNDLKSGVYIVKIQTNGQALLKTCTIMSD
ncbi:T9SS type A sorting domain-containing protein, partial [bacterium]|nr:T9SS type A sorting domain-containing protein [bacterium]